eukprot:10154856-Lingulodinium_polyedra.AAC.1
MPREEPHLQRWTAQKHTRFSTWRETTTTAVARSTGLAPMGRSSSSSDSSASAPTSPLSAATAA